MEDKPTSGFKIGTDDDAPEDPFVRPARQTFTTGTDTPHPPRRMDVRRLTVVNRRLTLLSVLLPMLMVAIAWGGYFIIKKEVINSQTAGIGELRISVQNLEAQVTALNEKFGNIEATVEAKEDPLKEAFLVFERTSASLEEELKQINSHLKKMDADKAGKADVDALLKQMQAEQKKTLENMAEELQTLSSAVEPLKPLPETMSQLQKNAMQSEEKQAKDLAGLTQSLETIQGNINALTAELNKTKAETVDLLSGTIDKNDMTQAMRNYASKYQTEVNSLAKSLNAKDRAIRSITQQLKRLEQKVDNLAKRRAVPGKPTKHGSFIEQDLSN